MKRGTAVLLGVLTALLGLTGVGQAQPPASIQVQGVIRAVDCNAGTVTLDNGGGTGVYRVARAALITVNSAPISFCALQQYQGTSATVWVTAAGNELVVTRLDAAGQAYGTPPPAPYAPQAPYAPPAPYAQPAPYPPPAPYYAPPAPYYAPPAPYYAPPAYYPAPYPYPVPAPAPYYAPPAYYPAPPIVGVVLGTVVVAGLVYLLVRHPGGAFYRYPYWGPYRSFYYQPHYGPYFGPHRYAPAYWWCRGHWCR